MLTLVSLYLWSFRSGGGEVMVEVNVCSQNVIDSFCYRPKKECKIAFFDHAWFWSSVRGRWSGLGQDPEKPQLNRGQRRPDRGWRQLIQSWCFIQLQTPDLLRDSDQPKVGNLTNIRAVEKNEWPRWMGNLLPISRPWERINTYMWGICDGFLQ